MLQGEAWRRGGLDAGSNSLMELSPHQPQGCPALPASLTTLSSGTERLRVHSWLFTKESAGEKAACRDWWHPHLCHWVPAVSYTAPFYTQRGPQPSP